MGYYGMTRAEIEAEIKIAADSENWRRFGPKHWTCRHGVNFAQKDYPYALCKDVTYCKFWGELMENPDEPSEELKGCWEG